MDRALIEARSINRAVRHGFEGLALTDMLVGQKGQSTLLCARQMHEAEGIAMFIIVMGEPFGVIREQLGHSFLTTYLAGLSGIARCP